MAPPRGRQVELHPTSLTSYCVLIPAIYMLQRRYETVMEKKNAWRKTVYVGSTNACGNISTWSFGHNSYSIDEKQMKSSLQSVQRAEAAQRGSLLPANARQRGSRPLKIVQSQRIARPREGGAAPLPPPTPSPPSQLQAPHRDRVPFSRRRQPEQRIPLRLWASHYYNGLVMTGSSRFWEWGGDASWQEVTVWTGMRPVAFMGEGPVDV